ncbi:MAG: AmmeMemoRadiSam system protein B [Myxococcales bacterium]|nr:AmmeMemoRadiSam system protein B [Myxococcales bacterium]
MTAVRPPAVAGTFYPGEPSRLAALVEELTFAAGPPRDGPLRALIVPHAGYLYSGPVAATAYAQLRPHTSRFRRVVLLGPSHFVPVRGFALPEAEALSTPLGTVPIDGEGASTAARFQEVAVSAPAHAREHSLEVQMPFLQRLLPSFSCLPLAVGRAEPELVADVLEALWGGGDTLVLISTDLSHYLPYEEAKRVDLGTAGRILRLEATVSPEEACGAAPLNGLLLAARRLGLKPSQLDLRSSGDTAGDRRQVVGYGAFALYEPRGGAP